MCLQEAEPVLVSLKEKKKNRKNCVLTLFFFPPLSCGSCATSSFFPFCVIITVFFLLATLVGAVLMHRNHAWEELLLI